MLEFILGMLNSSSLLIFGVFVSAAILSIPFTKKNILMLSFLCLGINAVQLVFYFEGGLRGAQRVYPFITHLPNLLLYALYYKKNVLHSVYAITSAYLCCQLSKWLTILLYAATGELYVEYGFRTVFTLFLGYVIIRYFAETLGVILTKSRKTILIFSILPVSYYLFDYTATVYTDLLYSGSVVILEFMPFVLCVAYLIFSLVYFKEYEEKMEAEHHTHLMNMKRDQFEKEIESMKRSEYAVAILRHDMRHFLTSISAFIDDDEPQKAKEYIKEVMNLSDHTARMKFCENEIVNMILSSYESKIKAQGIRFSHSINIPEKLPVSDVDFTSILSNGLENAIHAVSQLPLEKRQISLSLKMKEDKLLLSIKNPYLTPVILEDGLPKAMEEGHGLGTRSIRHVAEKLSGNCQFLAKDGEFVLRVVL